MNKYRATVQLPLGNNQFPRPFALKLVGRTMPASPIIAGERYPEVKIVAVDWRGPSDIWVDIEFESETTIVDDSVTGLSAGE